MRYMIGFMAVLLPLLSGAQTSPVKALTIGDTVPDMPTGIMINYSKPSARLSDFKNKLVILDFWSTWCVPCIKAMPGFEAMQQKFKGQVQFVLATSQEKEKIEKFLAMKDVRLPCFVEDKQLPKYFPHNSVPHEVWIKDNRVVAVTYAEEVTEQNIQKVLDGQEIRLVEKKSNFDYNIFQPLLVAGNGGNANDLLYHSVITGYLDGIAGAGGVMTDSANRYKIRVMDASIARLYSTAAQQYNLYFSLSNRTLIRTNQEQVLPPANPQYTPSVRKYFYCYELAIPAADKKNAGQYMMEDLNRFFGSVYHIRGSIEKIKTKCWVLKKMDNFKSIASKGGVPRVGEEGDFEVWHNAPFSDFFYTISYINQKQPYPFVDKTGISGKVDIRLPQNIKGMPSLQSYLTKYRLRLSLEECETPILVIKNNY